jgi:uncharacterized protein
MKTSSKRSSTLCETEAVAAAAVVTKPADRAATALIQKVIEFCHLLRAYELEVTPGRIIDAFRALAAVNIFRREDFYTLLEANVISRASDRELFQQLFARFWRGPTWAPIPDPCLPAWDDGCELPPPTLQQRSLQFAPREQSEQTDAGQMPQPVGFYSPVEILSRKDFGKMAEQELLQVQRLIMTMARQMATRVSRRKKAAAKAASIDPGRTLRRSLHYGGEVMEIVRRGPKIGKTKLVLLCDVSGSMDVYTKFLLQFLYGLQNGLRGVETVVFSTRLTRITPLLRRRHIDAALALIAETVHDWSGGTKIGACLQIFNETLAPRLVDSKTLVIIISDGWDTGDTAVLDAEMAKLKARALRLIWLNPLLGSPNYQPLCKGMHTALPYVDDFMPVHNVESLRQFGRRLESLT